MQEEGWVLLLQRGNLGVGNLRELDGGRKFSLEHRDSLAHQIGVLPFVLARSKQIDLSLLIKLASSLD